MSEQVTHLATFDDCRRLALEADDGVLAEEVKRVLGGRRRAGRMGSLSRGNNNNLVPGVLKAREHWDERAGDEQFEREFVYVLGWYTHRATDRCFKPRFRDVDPEYGAKRNRAVYPRVDGGGPKNLTKIYHDAVLYDRIYDGDRDPFRPGNFEVSMGSHPASTAVDVTRVEDVFQHKWMAELIASYECVSGSDGLPDEGTIHTVLDQRQTATYRTRWYQEAYHEPDIRHMERFINEPNFYDEDDPIVSLARSIQRGESPDVDFADVLANPGDSQYAVCLAKSYRYLRAASDLFAGENTPRETAEIVAVGWMYEEEDPQPHPTVDADPHELDDLPLAEVAAVEDALRLAFGDESLSERTRDVLTEEPGAAYAGAFAEPGNWLAETLESSRSRFAYRNHHGIEKIAFASGVVAHDRVGRRLKDGDESRLARDVTVLRERSAHADPEAADADGVADLFEGLVPRVRQRWHTLRADRNNFVPWSQRFFTWIDDQPERLREYADAYADGETAGTDFYDADDSLVQLARSTRDARTTDLPDLDGALANADEQSRYARTLADALEGIRVVDAYAEEEIDADGFLSQIA